MAGNKGLKLVTRLPEVNKLSKLVIKVLGRELRRILSREGEGGERRGREGGGEGGGVVRCPHFRG